MLRPCWALLSTLVIALPDVSSQRSKDATYSIVKRSSEDSLFDQLVVEPIDSSELIAPSLLSTYDTSNGDFLGDTGISPQSDGSEILSSTSNAISDRQLSSSAGSDPAFKTAFAPDKDPESVKPPCASPNLAACCVENSMFTSCVWWDLDRIFCEDPSNYACCESIQDYIGSNCEKVGEEGKDWDWLEDILRTPIIIEPSINPLEYFPKIPLIPERV